LTENRGESKAPPGFLIDKKTPTPTLQLIDSLGFLQKLDC
jgi:hypothetical protein